MEKLKIEVEVPKEAYELADGLAKIVGSVKSALADGWTPGSDIPVIVTSSLTHLVPAIQGVDQLDDEAKADPAGFSKALALGIADAVGVALKK